MKIGGTRSTAPTTPANRAKAANSAQAPGAAAPIDETIIAGIPSAELTPRVREALTTLITEVQELRAELAAARGRLRDLESIADADPLVSIYNRRAFVRELERVLAMVDRYRINACLIFIDLNDLKLINDKYGHAAGDAALVHVAEKLSENIRQTDVAGRLGGDEFAIVLTHLDEDKARSKAVSLAEIIAAESVAFNDQRFPVSISYGIAPIASGTSADQTMEKADTAMYESKRRR